jgi:Flp pilus assembly pilin Flp
MKNFVARFIRNQSGAVSLEDGLTIFSLTIGFIGALALMNGTFVQLYASIFGMLPGSHWVHAMAKIAIPPDLAVMFAACEAAYERATREGYGENPSVIAGITALKSAWAALRAANRDLLTTKGFFAVEFATMRAERASRACRQACVELHAAVKEAATEHRLYKRCLMTANQRSDTGQVGDAATAHQNEQLRRLA